MQQRCSAGRSRVVEHTDRSQIEIHLSDAAPPLPHLRLQARWKVEAALQVQATLLAESTGQQARGPTQVRGGGRSSACTLACTKASHSEQASLCRAAFLPLVPPERRYIGNHAACTRRTNSPLPPPCNAPLCLLQAQHALKMMRCGTRAPVAPEEGEGVRGLGEEEHR